MLKGTQREHLPSKTRVDTCSIEPIHPLEKHLLQAMLELRVASSTACFLQASRICLVGVI